jgi:hypothetical protein
MMMATVVSNPSRKDMVNRLFALKCDGVKVFLTPDGIAFLTGTFFTDKKSKKTVSSVNGGKKIVFAS